MDYFDCVKAFDFKIKEVSFDGFVVVQDFSIDRVNLAFSITQRLVIDFY